MTIAIVGASGFIGSELTHQLLDTTKHSMVLFSHRASSLRFSPDEERRLKHFNGSVLEPADITAALRGCDLAIYLVHLMGNGNDFVEREKTAANNFAAAVTAHDIRRVVYVGGMGTGDGSLTEHLASRSTTGAMLRKRVPQLIEFRTPMVIGDGGAGFEVLKFLVDRLPVFLAPSWVNGVTAPITCADVARYIRAALTMPGTAHLSVDIGGPEAMSYQEVARRYANWRGRRFTYIALPFVPRGAVIGLFRILRRNRYAATVADMLGSASYSPDNDFSKVHELFDVNPEKIERGFMTVKR